MSCIVIRNRHGNLAFRLFWNGIESWEGTKGLKDTPENRKLMEAQAVLISSEIRNGTFDYLRWFPYGNKAGLFKAEKSKAGPKTIREYYQEWITDKIPPFVKKSRGRKYRSHFDAHILPAHGELYVHLYSVTEIRDLRARLVDQKKLSMKTAKNVVNATLRAFFRDAAAEGVIQKNPFDELPKKWWPRTARPEPEPFTEAERDEILAYFQKKHWRTWPQGVAFLYAQFWAGTRPSEIVGRRWKDYDPRTGKLSIGSSRAEGEEGATKTAKSQRTIELLPPVRECLEQIRALRATPMTTSSRTKPGSRSTKGIRSPAFLAGAYGPEDYEAGLLRDPGHLHFRHAEPR